MKPERSGPPFGARAAWPRARRRLLACLAVCALRPAAGCASGPGPVGVETIRREGDVPAAASAAVAAASACGLRLLDGHRDDADGRATLVLLSEWQNPKPESALVTVLCAPAPDGVTCRVEAHPLAEYGMRPQDIRAGSGSCLPCAAARAEIPMVRYSRGLAMGNAARAARCLGDALAPAGPPPG